MLPFNTFENKLTTCLIVVFAVIRKGSGSVVECLTGDKGPGVGASPASLCCVLEQDTLILA